MFVVTMKKCAWCKKELSFAHFGIDNHLKSGLKSLCRICDSERNRRWRHSQQGKAWKIKNRPADNERNKKRRKTEWVKIRAREVVKEAIVRGSLKREPCAKCGEEKVQAHHSDYQKRLQVVWLCSAHHGEVHRDAV